MDVDGNLLLDGEGGWLMVWHHGLLCTLREMFGGIVGCDEWLAEGRCQK